MSNINRTPENKPAASILNAISVCSKSLSLENPEAQPARRMKDWTNRARRQYQALNRGFNQTGADCRLPIQSRDERGTRG